MVVYLPRGVRADPAGPSTREVRRSRPHPVNLEALEDPSQNTTRNVNCTFLCSFFTSGILCIPRRRRCLYVLKLTQVFFFTEATTIHTYCKSLSSSPSPLTLWPNRSNVTIFAFRSLGSHWTRGSWRALYGFRSLTKKSLFVGDDTLYGVVYSFEMSFRCEVQN